MTREAARGDRRFFDRARYGQEVRGVSFAGEDLTSVSTPDHLRFDRCSFARADLRQATLDGASLRFCDLRGADLRGASLRGTHFGGCDLTGADLRGADLHGASFGAVNTGDDSGRTVLTGVLLDEAALRVCDVQDGTPLPGAG